VTDYETRPADWFSADDAIARILQDVRPLPKESVPLGEALGRALAQEVHARWRLPPWDDSAMDGYAARAEDIEGAAPDRPVALNVIGRILAGEQFGRSVAKGDAVRIMTGGPIPPGADTVVRVEDTDREATPGTVHVLDDRDARRHVRPGGQDWDAGDLVLSSGTGVRPGTIGVLAAAGESRVSVTRRPHVAVLPTGSELFDIASPEPSVGVPESNSHMVAAQAVEAGAVADRRDATEDDVQALIATLRDAGSADVIVTIGGASMGEGDLVKRALDALDYAPAFWRVKIRPGSPLSFGFLTANGSSVPVFGLPGNPVSAFVTFEVFVRPLLRRLGGYRRIDRVGIRARAAEPLPTAEHLTQYLRVRVSGEPGEESVSLAGPQGSGLMSGLSAAEGLAIVPEGVGEIPTGELVDVRLLS
jgi:molybdopterin molybdotransferase